MIYASSALNSFSFRFQKTNWSKFTYYIITHNDHFAFPLTTLLSELYSHIFLVRPCLISCTCTFIHTKLPTLYQIRNDGKRCGDEFYIKFVYSVRVTKRSRLSMLNNTFFLYFWWEITPLQSRTHFFLQSSYKILQPPQIITIFIQNFAIPYTIYRVIYPSFTFFIIFNDIIYSEEIILVQFLSSHQGIKIHMAQDCRGLSRYLDSVGLTKWTQSYRQRTQ